MKVFKIILLVCFFLGGLFSWAEVEERQLEVYSEANTAKSVIQSLEKNLTEELVQELLNLESLENFRNSIGSKILPQSRKFILSSQILNTSPVEEALTPEQMKLLKPNQKFVSSLRVRFSKDTLMQVLIDENLYYLDKSSNRILLLIEFKDEVHKRSHRWWSEAPQKFQGKNSEEESFLKTVDFIYSKIQSGFLKNGFYALNPVFNQLYYHLPKRGVSSTMNLKNASTLAKYFKAQLVVLGSVQLSSLSRAENQVVWDIVVYNADSLRQVSSYTSRFKVTEDSFSPLLQRPVAWVNDSALKINSLYQKGVLSAQLFKVELKGKLREFKVKEIKNMLVNQVPSIKSLTESVIEADRIQYEADVNGDYKKVLKEIDEIQNSQYRFSSVVKDKNYIVIQVQALGSKS